MKSKPFWIALGTLAALTLLLLSIEIVSASPAAPISLTLTQPDGSKFLAKQWGDEWNNGFQTLDGYTIIQVESGWWVYARLSPQGTLTPFLDRGQSVPVGAEIPPTLTRFVRPDPLFPRLQTPEKQAKAPSSIGNQPVLVLLASFSNRSPVVSASLYSAQFFGTSGSVKDYYQKASYNQLNLTSAAESYGTANDGVVGWLNLGYNHPNTGSSFTSANQLIVKNALTAADSYVNFASYDLDSNGYISASELHIVVIVAGYERSYSNNSPSIWSHRWFLNNVVPPILDGKVLGDYYFGGGYAQVGELHYDHQATMGVIAHEMGHDLFWPDLYDIDGSSDGVGNWSLMGTGLWNTTLGNYQGVSPALPDAWLKWYQGWLTPTTIIGSVTGVSIPKADSNASAFLLRLNSGGVDWLLDQHSGSGEYFLVENRQLVGYDSGLPGCGLTIWHIDESVTYTNSANATEAHPLVKLIQADGLDELLLGDSQDSERGDSGDPYPGVTSNQTFDDTSTPNSKLYDGSNSQASVTNISNCSPTMTADLTYNVPTNQAPIANAGTDQLVFTQATVILDGSGSYDPDGNTPLTYQWTQGSGPPVVLDDYTAISPTFSAPSQPAILSFSLTVTDSLGLSSTQDWVVITVQNSPPVADAGPDQKVRTLSLVTLDGSSSYDPDGNTPITFLWIQTSGTLVPLSNPAVPNPTFTAPPLPSVLVFDLSVTDSLGLSSAVDSVTITVEFPPLYLPLILR